MKPTVLILALCLSGCAVHRPAPTTTLGPFPVKQQVAEGQHSHAEQPDSSHANPDSTSPHNPTPSKAPSEKPGLLARVFHSGQVKQDKKNTSNPRAFINPTSVPKKCKGCQFTIITGNDNKVSQATIGKNKAAAVVNSDSATQQIATNAVAGKGNTATQTATTKQAAGPLAVLAQNLTGWIPWVIGGALILAVVFRKRLPIVGPFFS